MSDTSAREMTETEIPVIDMGPLHEATPAGARAVADRMTEAAQTIGFFYVRNHGIPPELIAQTDAVARRFFAFPPEDKLSVKVSPAHRGFIRVGESKMAGQARSDLKESFIWGLDVDPDAPPANPLLGPNQWPAFVPDMRATLNAYFSAANQCGVLLYRAFAAALGVPLDYFTRRFDRPTTRGSLVFYPPQPADADGEQFGVSPHTDFGSLTLLYQDPIGGLQVQGREGEWLVARPIEGTLVVNIGDLMERWTNNRFKSTPHRVINRTGRQRLSIAVFVDPNFETPVVPVCRDGEAPQYEPVTCGEYIISRYDASFAYRNKPTAR